MSAKGFSTTPGLDGALVKAKNRETPLGHNRYLFWDTRDRVCAGDVRAGLREIGSFTVRAEPRYEVVGLRGKPVASLPVMFGARCLPQSFRSLPQSSLRRKVVAKMFIRTTLRHCLANRSTGLYISQSHCPLVSTLRLLGAASVRCCSMRGVPMRSHTAILSITASVGFLAHVSKVRTEYSPRRISPATDVQSNAVQCAGHRTSGRRRVSGVIKWADGSPLAGGKVRAWDSDIGPDDPMGDDITNACGEYTLTYADGHWDPFPHRITRWRPDIYITVAVQESGQWLRAKESNTSSNHRLREHLTKNATVNPLPTIFGVVRSEADNNAPVPGVRVKAWDWDPGADDKMGDATTDKAGKYEIRYARKDWDYWVLVQPDIYTDALKDGRKVAHHSKVSNWTINQRLQMNMTIPKPDPKEARAPQKTCSGGNPEASFGSFSFVLQEKQYGCLAKSGSQPFVASEWANSREEAEACVLSQVGDPNGSYTEVHDPSAVMLRYFTILDYNTCPLGDPKVGPSYCVLRQEPTVSAIAGLSCVAGDYRLSDRDIRVNDVTRLVQRPDGGVDYSAWNRTCPTECKP